MDDQAAHIGAIGTGTSAKLAPNCTSAFLGVALAEIFAMGIKAGVEPLELWEAVRQAATGRVRTVDRLGQRFLTGLHDPTDFRTAAIAQGCRARSWSRAQGRRADAARQHGL